MNRKRVTIKDVAVEAGVTHTTVSRVIHNDERISQETQGRVRKAMEDLAYRPNLIARGLVRNRTQVIALITPELAPFTQPIVRSVAERCARMDYTVMLFPTNTWINEDVSFEWVVHNWLVDGIVVYNLIYHERVPQEFINLRRSHFPFVFVNKFLDSDLVNAVGVDNKHAVSLVVGHFKELGHRRIGMLYGNLDSEDGMGRLGAFRQALRRHELPFDESLTACGYWYEDPACKAMKQLLDRPERPTAVFCANDIMAIGALRAARERGLRVPEDLAVAGFDDLEAGRYLPVPLTTIHPPLFDAGCAAVDLLMRLLKDPTRPPEQVRLKSELVVRASTAGMTTPRPA